MKRPRLPLSTPLAPLEVLSTPLEVPAACRAWRVSKSGRVVHVSRTAGVRLVDLDAGGEATFATPSEAVAALAAGSLRFVPLRRESARVRPWSGAPAKPGP